LHNPESCGAAELIFFGMRLMGTLSYGLCHCPLSQRSCYICITPLHFFFLFFPQHNHFSFLLCRLLGMWSWGVSFKRRGGNLDKTGLDSDTAGVSLRGLLIYKYINTIPLLLLAHESPQT
jgi:hypothetical protein